VARLDKEIAASAQQFALLRIGNMRGVNLDLFDFDYDLTWVAFFVNADGTVYGRYGGRDAEAAGKYLSLTGLKHALDAALAQHRQERKSPPPATARVSRRVEELPAVKRLSAKACIHCHHVYDFRRAALQDAAKWSLDEVWVYPLPENIGLTVAAERGNQVRQVAAGSAAERAGLKAGDTLQSLNGLSVASFADVQYALHRAPVKGTIPLSWQREGRTLSGNLTLADGWRKTDLSWRQSLKGLQPASCVHGSDLTPAEKKELGLDAKRLAFRQGPFVSKAAEQAGIRQNDILLGVDGRVLDMTARQFDAYIRVTYRVGDTITFNILRAGQRLDLPMKLPG
jgi:predicted metalloprotease with PDZ domain